MVLIFQASDIFNAILEGYPKPKKELFVSTCTVENEVYSIIPV